MAATAVTLGSAAGGTRASRTARRAGTRRFISRPRASAGDEEIRGDRRSPERGPSKVRRPDVRELSVPPPGGTARAGADAAEEDLEELIGEGLPRGQLG